VPRPYNSAIEIKGLVMPIYAYRCSACGHAQDHLQKISDDPLHTCPACGAAAYAKQVTAAGFQLKGSGWYVTDFRGGNTGAGAKKDEGGDKAAEKTGEKTGEKAADKAADKPAATATPAPAPAAAPSPSAAAD
jgi:putative FmdB family regulatory protein